jgi:hypothetical protein
MNLLDIPMIRLENQLINNSDCKTPLEVVKKFGAIQAQDYAAAKWAIGLRMEMATDQLIEEAFNQGEILRTHVMRPTWHFVAPEDIRWLLELTGPRVQAFNGSYYRKSGLDKSIFKQSNEIIRKSLLGGNQLNRNEIEKILIKEKIPTDKLGLSFIVMQAELEGIICSGPRKGKQFTYMLLDERVPIQKKINPEEALKELIKRYFQSHGPAQLKDFVWWSGLTVSDAKKGIEMNGNKFKNKEIDGKIYWYINTKPKNPDTDEAFLIPGFDEYFIAYKDRADILNPLHIKNMNAGGGMINGALLLNGIISGTWKRKLSKSKVLISINTFSEINDNQHALIKKFANKYAEFHKLNPEIEIKKIN